MPAFLRNIGINTIQFLHHLIELAVVHLNTLTHLVNFPALPKSLGRIFSVLLSSKGAIILTGISY